MFQQGMFAIDPNSTPDQVRQKRAMIAALLPKFGSARFVGEGIGQLATGVMAGRQGRKLDEIEGKGTASANSLWERLMGTANSAQSPDMGPLTVLGMQPEGPAMPPPDPNSPHALGDDAMAALGKPAMKTAADPASIKAGLVARGLPEHVAEGFVMNFQDESGLNPGINEAAPTVPGSRGGFGLYQLTGPRRRAYESYAAEKGVPLDDVDAQLDFMMMELQGPEAAAWSKISGTQNAGEAGAAIVNSFLRPAEEHRASRAAKYLGGTTAAPAPTSAPSIPINELYMALQNPWLSGEQKGLITSMIQEQQQASDPLRQLELQKAQLELEKMQAPASPPEELVLRQALAAEAGYEKGTPEYQSIIISGKLPEAPAPVKPYSDIGQINADLSAGLITPADAEAAKAALAKGGTNVTVNNVPGTPPSDEALRKKLMEAEGVAWGEYIKAGSTASGMTQDMELLGQVIEMAPQGPISGRLAEAFPGVSDAAGVFQSVVKRIAPSLRVEGSGAQSDIEYNGFLQSLPSLSNRPEANRAIATFLKAKAAINMERGQVIQQYQNGEIDATAARTKIKEIDSRSILSPELKNLLGSMDGGAESGDMSEDDAAYLRSLGMEP